MFATRSMERQVPGNTAVITARPQADSAWPANNTTSITRKMDTTWDVNMFGQPVSTTPAARWNRGTIGRWGAPDFRPSKEGLIAYDPTNPETWYNVPAQRHPGAWK
jgi:hypothetical protein